VTATLDAPAVSPLWRGLGIYSADELSLEAYHRDIVPGGSLSSSGARKILEAPAKFDHYRRNPQPPKKEFEFGTAAHRIVLGDGPDIDVLPYDNYRTKVAQAAAAEARAMGAIPLLTHEHAQVQAMADALLRHPLASILLDPARGKPEQSMYLLEPNSNAMVRSRPDWITTLPNGRIVLTDYKTARSAAEDAFTKAIQDHGYYMQAPWYLDIAVALNQADDDAEFLFIVQEKEPPFLANVIGLDTDWLRMGRVKNRAAIDIYARCQADGHWPGYETEPSYLTQPTWAEIKDTEEYLT